MTFLTGGLIKKRDPVVASIEQILGQRIRQPALIHDALRHRSVAREHPHSDGPPSNERLEFLGDAVLGLSVARFLYNAFPDRDEGFLTRIRSRLVNGEALARYARGLGLHKHIEMSENMERTGGRENVSILADTFEAVLGALYLDRGLRDANRFVVGVLEEMVDLDEIAERRENFKSLLLELAQARGWTQPRYRTVWERGPSHDKEFCVEVVLNDRSYDRGVAKSKKRAEQIAAAKTFKRLSKDIGSEL